MKRDEYLAAYCEQIAPMLKETQQKFAKNLVKHSEQLKALLLENFQQMQDLIVTNEKEYVMFFYFSLLKIDVLKRAYTIVSQAMDSRWYLDEEMIETSFNVDFLFEPMNQLWDLLLAESQKYLGKINAYDIQQLIFAQLKLSNNGIAHFLRYLLRDLVKELVFQEIPKTPYWIIRWGEYRDDTQIVLLQDQDPKTQKEWNIALRKAAKGQEDLANTYWYQAELKNSQCQQLDMQFITFEGCQLDGFQFKDSNLTAARFFDTKLISCSFAGCNLQGADFYQAAFEQVDFQGADLKNAFFAVKDLPYLHLSPEQLQDIIVRKEEADAVFSDEAR